MKCNTNLNILVRSLKYAALLLKERDLQQSALNTTTRAPFFSTNFAPKTFRISKYRVAQKNVYTLYSSISLE